MTKAKRNLLVAPLLLSYLRCGDFHMVNYGSAKVSQNALLQASETRLTGALSKGGKMRGVATNVYLWKTSEKPKETGQKENSKFGSCIYV